MLKIFDEQGKLCHMVFHDFERLENGRIDIAPENQFLQVSALNLKKGTTFKPHKHIWKDSFKRTIAQESWCVLKGKVECIFYDSEGNFLQNVILESGDISLTFEGGHNYYLEEDSVIYEYKTGPYMGQELDKEFL